MTIAALFAITAIVEAESRVDKFFFRGFRYFPETAEKAGCLGHVEKIEESWEAAKLVYMLLICVELQGFN